MALENYSKDKDYFELNQPEGSLSFPCCCCDHRFDEPETFSCEECGHNENSDKD